MSVVTDFKETWYGRVLVAVVRFLDKVVCFLWAGKWGHTLSAYLGATDPDCRLCRWLSKNVEESHCIKAALSEGLM